MIDKQFLMRFLNSVYYSGMEKSNGSVARDHNKHFNTFSLCIEMVCHGMQYAGKKEKS